MEKEFDFNAVGDYQDWSSFQCAFDTFACFRIPRLARQGGFPQSADQIATSFRTADIKQHFHSFNYSFASVQFDTNTCSRTALVTTNP